MTTPMDISNFYFGRVVVPDPNRASWDVRFNPTGPTTEFYLPAGPCRVSASWGGPTPAKLYVQTSNGDRLPIGVLNGGGHSIIVPVGALAGDHIRIGLDRKPTVEDVKYTGTLECFVTPQEE